MENLPTVYAVHGFLGQPNDWKVLYPSLLPIKKMISVDLYKIATPALGFESWALSLNKQALEDSAPRILLGYSLGGRLALHALLQQPKIWDGAIFISTHGGIEHSAEKQNRLKEDLIWSKKFYSESWLDLLNDWNARSAFAYSKKLNRIEENFSRKLLSET
jgi:2-succinyl-6-hydroxy-2,4-cyclohexadiene-1-carboxylate synthase